MCHSCSKDRDSVRQYVLHFNKCGSMQEAIARASLPITNYVLGEDADAGMVLNAMGQTGLTLAAFPAWTKYAIASDFRDKEMTQEMQIEAEAISLTACHLKIER